MFRTLRHAALCMLLILACVYTAKAQCPAATPLVINSITTTESRCTASGTATVSVSGGSAPYTYSIVNGPTLRPAQSSNILQSLMPGAYTVQVTDNCNISVTRNFTVTGNYTVPVPTITPQSPTCAGGSDGSITFTASGRAPFTYSLISPSPITRGPQAANVFTGLPAGNYTCQVTDSCGNFQTRTVTLNAPSSAVALNNYSIQYLDCDSFAVILTFFISDYRPPYTITVTPPGRPALTHVLTAPVVNAGSFNDTFRIRFHHTTGAFEQMPLTIANQCGLPSTGNIPLSTNMDLSVIATLPGGCGSQYTYMFDRDPSLHCGTITYTLVSPSGALLATQTNNSTFSGFPPGSGYKVVRQDCCRKDSLTFNWDAGPAFKISYTQNLPYATCREGTTSLYIEYNFTNQPADIVLVSGPPSVRFGDGTVHTYTYPDTIKDVYSRDIVGNFGAGAYKLYVINKGCGQKDSITITFRPNDVRHSVFTASLQKGCADANRLLLNTTSNTSWAPGNITVNSIFNKTFLSPSLSNTDSLMNLSPGTYFATYQYHNIYSPRYIGAADPGCDVIKDTIVVPVYTQPRFSSTAAVALCGTTRQVALLPDSTSGVAPYNFQITLGPATRPLQASPAFTGLTSGTYTFLMADACLNSYSQSITIDTLVLPNVVTTGSTCVGSTATFTLPASPFYNYSWRRPNGSTGTGNTLTLNPVTLSDIGAYTISATCTIAGCTSTTSRSVMLNACQVLPQTLLHFSGQRKNSTIQLNWQTADENMRYYIVERSTDGFVFTPVQQVAAREGGTNNYTAIDAQLPAGSVYYRLQSVEKSGTINYSNIISFNNVNEQPFNVFPSLVTGNTPVTVTCPVTSHTSFIRVVGVDGRVLKTIPVAAGVTKTSIDVTSLARGSYFVAFTGNENTVTTQIWKE